MNKTKLISILPAFILSFAITSCGPTIKTTSVWVNREKLPAEPLKSVFIIAFTDNMKTRVTLEDDLAAAAEKRGLKAYKSVNIIGPVEMHLIAPVKDVFVQKLRDLNCEAIFTVALVHETSETKYIPSSTTSYSPYGYGGYGGYGAYGGFGGYYGYAVGTMSTPGYYSTDTKYFLEAKLFELNTDELLLSIQTKAHNPAEIEKSSKEYTLSLMNEINELRPKKK